MEGTMENFSRNFQPKCYIYSNLESNDSKKNSQKNVGNSELRVSLASVELCDALIRVPGADFIVNRLVLATESEYFLAFFKYGRLNGWCTNGGVFHDKADSEIMKQVVLFVYQKEIDITFENIQELFITADRLLMPNLLKTCSDFMLKNITYENCISVYRFSQNYSSATLKSGSHSFILRNFADVAEFGHEFLSLEFEELWYFASHYQLNIRNEEIVFRAILRWVEFNQNRMRKLHLLLPTVRTGLLNRDFVVDGIIKNHVVNDCPKSRFFMKYMLDELDRTAQDEVKHLYHPLYRPRRPHDLLVVLGGWETKYPGTYQIGEVYDIRADQWLVKIGMKHGPRVYHGSVVLGKRIYVIGGFDGNDKHLNSVFYFDTVSRAWEEVSPMNQKRCYVSVVVVKNYIYAIGGFDGIKRLNTAERFDAASNQWTLVANMHEQRSDASAVCTGSYVIVCGGFNGTDVINTCEIYNPSRDQWTQMAPMINCRSGLGVVLYQQGLYAIGGYNGMVRLSTCEKFDFRNKEWKSISSMASPKSHAGVIVIDDSIYAIGGFNGATSLDIVELYDEFTDDWYEVQPLLYPRSGHSICVVKNVKNIDKYIERSLEDKDSKAYEFNTALSSYRAENMECIGNILTPSHNKDVKGNAEKELIEIQKQMMETSEGLEEESKHEKDMDDENGSYYSERSGSEDEINEADVLSEEYDFDEDVSEKEL